jgi:hypothetical protein
MVTLAGSQVWWTWETEDSFRRVREGDKHAMKTYASKLMDQLSQLTGMVSGLLHVLVAATDCRADVRAGEVTTVAGAMQRHAECLLQPRAIE